MISPGRIGGFLDIALTLPIHVFIPHLGSLSANGLLDLGGSLANAAFLIYPGSLIVVGYSRAVAR